MAKKNVKKSTKAVKKAAAKPTGTKAAKPRKAAPKSQPRKRAKPKLLSGGNPQIAKADGDAPVQAYIAAMPGWKSKVGRRLDAIIVLHRARRLQSREMELALLRHRAPRGQRGLVPRHPLLHEVHQSGLLPRRVARPVPPAKSKQKEVRYLDIHEDDEIDEAQFAAWVKQASRLPGVRM